VVYSWSSRYVVSRGASIQLTISKSLGPNDPIQSIESPGTEGEGQVVCIMSNFCLRFLR
jgi:hypothetical protein